MKPVSPYRCHRSKRWHRLAATSISIRYDIPAHAGSSVPVLLEIFNIRGQKAATLIDEPRQPGAYLALWDGRNYQGVPASSGIYIYRIIAGDFVRARKMTFLK